jgi:putative hemolysin
VIGCAGFSAKEIASVRAKRRSRMVLPGLIAYSYVLPMPYIELAIVVALIHLNGLLVLAELAIVSSRRARLQALVDSQVIGSRRALALATDPGRFLWTVQIGITLVGVLSGAFSGATLGLHLAKWFVDLGLRASVAEAVSVGLVRRSA